MELTNTQKTFQRLPSHHIGFVSTRFIGIDGVSLEAEKWSTVLEALGHSCYYFSGQSDRPATRNYIVPEAHFKHADVERIYIAAFSERIRRTEITRLINQLKDHIKEQLIAFIHEFDIELLLVENALSIPLNLPLGLALTEFIAETGFHTIAHHHDFFWERKRFLVNCVWDYLNMAFPPHLPSIHHVVINSSAANQLSLRTGISSMLIPNAMDFDNPPAPPDEYTSDVRTALEVAPDELFFLQPTRIVPRKGIEHAIELISLLNRKTRLVISHASGDEGYAYEHHLRNYAERLDVTVNFVADTIRERRGQLSDGRKIYSLWDVYPYADIVTYPSDIEGFGNAFLEAIYFRRPIVVNNYSIFDTDIKPKGFRVIEFEGYINDETVEHTRKILDDPQLREEMVEHNYQLARRHYSYTMLERHLQTLLAECFGEDYE
ncbi:MAG: glycosyltransferase family 4 protein [Chloroflexi bacterium]|nr:glycosyltransferase family 4 protein [Chloroflexota bacterium]